MNKRNRDKSIQIIIGTMLVLVAIVVGVIVSWMNQEDKKESEEQRNVVYETQEMGEEVEDQAKETSSSEKKTIIQKIIEKITSNNTSSNSSKTSSKEVATDNEKVIEKKPTTENRSETEEQNQVIENKPIISDEKGKAEILIKEEASYEKRLAGAVSVGIKMQYYGADIKNIYIPSETFGTNKNDSEGIYIEFEVNGNTQCICSKPITNERQQAGSIDIKEESVGIATFDIVNHSEINKEAMQKLSVDDIQKQIEESLLVSLIEH